MRLVRGTRTKAGWVTAIATTGYLYKFTIAVLCTPLIYLVHALIEKYLGKEKATEMKKAALAKG